MVSLTKYSLIQALGQGLEGHAKDYSTILKVEGNYWACISQDMAD